jgi:hypothetical protein
MVDPASIRARFSRLSPHLGERGRHLFAAVEANASGRGGIAAVSRATGIAASTIGRGLKELVAEEPLAPGRVRRAGGGHRPLVNGDPSLLPDLLALVEPDERGNTNVAVALDQQGPAPAGARTDRVGAPDQPYGRRRTVEGAEFSLQANRKTREGSANPDRDAQFRHISKSVTEAWANRQPVISVDTKKKELVGHFKNGGREWRPQGKPEEVRVHDFLIKAFGRAVPYGIYDIASNAGRVSVGINHDTAAFAVQTIRRCWHDVGSVQYPDANCLLITADGGGSNGSRVRLWKRELQRPANEIGIDIVVHHLPPGTSKWNKIGVSRTHPRRKVVWNYTRDWGMPHKRESKGFPLARSRRLLILGVDEPLTIFSTASVAAVLRPVGRRHCHPV